MRRIDIETWPRRRHFELFSTWDHPHFSMCADVDLTAFCPGVKERDASFTVAIVYVIAQAANAIPEFRHRIRGTEVVEHEVVNPSMTVMGEGDLFGFCPLDYTEDFAAFAAGADERIAYYSGHPSLAEVDEDRDDWLFMTAIPWVSFTSFMHPLAGHPADSVPRFAWGRFREDDGRLTMPLSVQGHHALLDGVHVGRYYADVQRRLSQPDTVLGGV